MSDIRPLRIVFMGTPDFSVPTLKSLINAGHTVCGVYCQPDKEKGRGKKVQMPAVKEVALAYGLPVFQPYTLKDDEVRRELESLQPDVIIVVAYGKILPSWLIHLPEHGCLNVHASILPKYRGAAPIHYAVLNGDTSTGVTIMRMDEGLDTGDILDVVKTDIKEGETTGELFDRLSVLGGDSIVPVLDKWVKKEITAVSQKDYGEEHGIEVSYASKVTKDMGHIDWSQPASTVINLIRGLNPAPGCYSYINGKRLKIWSAVPADSADLTVSAVLAVPIDSASKNRYLLERHYEFKRTHENSEQLMEASAAEPVVTSDSVAPGTVLSVRNGLTVATGDGQAICITEVQPENKKRISAADFINGHQIKGGMVFDG